MPRHQYYIMVLSDSRGSDPTGLMANFWVLNCFLKFNELPIYLTTFCCRNSHPELNELILRTNLFINPQFVWLARLTLFVTKSNCVHSSVIFFVSVIERR